MFDLSGKVALVTAGSTSSSTTPASRTCGACRASTRTSHFFWNKEAPQVGETYPGLVPNEFEQWKMGIPGMHFPVPDAPAET